MSAPRFSRQAFLAATLVTELAALAIGGLLVGGWLDARLSCSPVFLLLLSLAGFGGGLWRLIHHLATQEDPPGDDLPPQSPR